MRKYSAGVAPLFSQGETFSDAPDKAKILNNKFRSVFTQEPIGSMPDKESSSLLYLPQIAISTLSVKKHLDNLKPHKASGPDSISPMVLKELINEIAPILQIIFQISFTTGQVPDDGEEANVAQNCQVTIAQSH